MTEKTYFSNEQENPPKKKEKKEKKTYFYNEYAEILDALIA